VATFSIITAAPLQSQPTPIDTTKYPGIDDFVPCEREPSADMSEIQRRLVYPAAAIEHDVEGKVLIRVLIDTKGKPRRYNVEQSVHALLDSAAAKAIMETSFSPAIQKSEPVSCWVTVPVVFKVDGHGLGDADAAFDKSALRDFTKLLVSDTIVVHLHAHVKINGTGRILTLELRDGNLDVAEQYPLLVQAIRKTSFFPARNRGVPRDSEVEFDIDLPMK
jgi:TonB family protein